MLGIRVALTLLFIAILILTGVQVHKLRPKWKIRVAPSIFFSFYAFRVEEHLTF